MKILHIVPALEAGGVETGTIDLAVSLKKLGEEVIVISNGGRLVKSLEDNGILHIKLPVHSKSPVGLLLIPKVASIIKSHDIDIVHASSRVPAWVGFLACKLTKTPFVTSCHGYYSRHFFSGIMARGKLVMVISKSIGERMKEAFGVPDKKIRLVYRGLDIAKYPYEPNKYNKEKKSFKIINLGRLTPIKGQHEFISAMRHVADRIKNVEAWIVGNVDPGKEEYLKELKSLTGKLKLTEHVKFLGLRSDTRDLLKKADLLVLSTTMPEGFGRALIEAGAIGTAVCASDIGGIPEIVENKTSGLLFPVKNIFNMADAIVRMLGDRVLSKKCAATLRKKVEQNFTLEKMTRSTLAVYREAINKA